MLGLVLSALIVGMLTLSGTAQTGPPQAAGGAGTYQAPGGTGPQSVMARAGLAAAETEASALHDDILALAAAGGQSPMSAQVAQQAASELPQGSAQVAPDYPLSGHVTVTVANYSACLTMTTALGAPAQVAAGPC